ncbi:DUF7269 family protein [Haloarcula salina]|uniref:Uncharacterized protein n=1 Tax=Haloarcula salina TaxID=1429914 RepID=A0AA41FY73_9EURY|nr:hypothetical protein [Haloarcula salina]MBV0900965.1 hypothetical protein [Haloarcula salina]
MTEGERSDETPDGVGRATVDASVERPEPGRRFLALTFAGLASLAAAVLVVTVPSLVPASESVDPAALRTLASAGAVAVGLVGLYTICFEPVPDGRAQREADDESHDDLLRDIESTERPSGGSADLVGGDIDYKLERIGGRVDPASGLEASYAADVRGDLRAAARRALVRRTERTRDEAVEAVETGTWTDDRRAAALLGGDAAPDPPIAVQVRDWASGEGFDRRVEAATAEIHALSEEGDR